MKQFLTRSLCFAALLAFLVPAAHSETVTRRVNGTGHSRDDAMRAGLVEAVRQVSGTVLESTSSSSQESSSRSESSSTSGGGRTSSASSVDSETYDEKTDTYTRGVVAGYTVVSETRDPDLDIWTVTMDVAVTFYRTPGLSPESRRKLVILPFKTVGNYPVGGNLLDAETVSRDMADRLITLFTQSRRFAVLSRQDDDVLQAEKDLIIREAPVTEMAKIGQTLGADYLLAGTVAMLDIPAPVEKTSAISGMAALVLPYARMKVQYRIVVVGTGQIKFADDIFVDLDRGQLRKAKGDVSAAYEMLKREAAHRIAWRALSAIYPAHVVDILDNGEIVFDEGGAMVFPGTYYDVFRLVAEVHSHSSGETLGKTEEKIATALVTRVDAKMSYATFVDGSVTWEDFDQGLIVRPARPDPELAPSAAAAYPAVSAPPAPGVKLPFD